MMPEVNGYELTRILRREPQFAATPILVLTAQSGLQDKLRIKFVLNAIFPNSNLSKDKLEAALGMPAYVTIPYVRDVFVEAINLGQPPVFDKPDLPISNVLEDFAFHVSKDTHKKPKPENPTDTWKRVCKRFQSRKIK